MDKGTQRFEQAGKVEDLLTEIFARSGTAFASGDMVDAEIVLPQAEKILFAAEKVRHRFRLASTIWSNEVVYRLKGDWAGA